MTALTFGSVCSGIGGIDLGFERAGMMCKWQIEIDDWCRRVLAKHWPDVRRYRDVKEVGAELEAIDVIVGGIPCQPFSVAGQQKGASDDRNLWPDYFRLVGALKPQWVVVENVPGIRTTMLDEMLSDLEGEGYTIATLNIPAIAFDAPHIRERIWIVGHATGGHAGRDYTGKSEGKGLEMGGDIQSTLRRNKSANFTNASGEDMAYPNSTRLSKSARGKLRGIPGQETAPSWGELSRGSTATNGGCKDMADTTSTGRETCSPHGVGNGEQERELSVTRSSPWEVEPSVGRVADGLPPRLERIRAKRLRGLGNAVVPQMAEWIARIIVKADARLVAADAEAGGE